MIPAFDAALKWAAAMLLGANLTCDPALTRLFTPLHPQWGEYEVCTDSRAIEAVVAAGDGSTFVGASEGVHYSDVADVEPLDAFGRAGTYDHPRLARLYGGERVKVARGWKLDGDRFESVTLLAPYPDASLTRLEEGTMVIRWSSKLSTAEDTEETVSSVVAIFSAISRPRW